MNKEKIKKFCKENGKTIIALGIGGTVGFCLAKYMRSGDRKLFDKLRKSCATFSPSQDGLSLIDDIYRAIGDSNYAEIHTWDKPGITVENLGELMIGYYQDQGKSLDTKINSLVMFQNVK